MPISRRFHTQRAGRLLRSLRLRRLPARSAALGSATRPEAAPTLVVDNSFALDTTDPHRGFDYTSTIVDRAVYDTLFTYRGGDLAHPVPLLVSSFRASANAKTLHVSAQAERPLRRRDTADCRRCRLLAEAARQPERESLVPPVRGRGVGERERTRSSSTCRRPSPSCPRSSRARRPASSTRGSSDRTGVPTPPTPPHPTRPSPGSTRPLPPAPAAGRTRSIRTAPRRRSCCARTRTTGARGGPRSAVS